MHYVLAQATSHSSLTLPQSAALALVTGLVGVLGGLVVSIYQTRTRRREAHLTTAHEHRREFLAVTAPLANVLTDLNPDRLAINASPATFDQLRERYSNWLARRDDVAIAGELNPNDELRYAARRILVNVNNTFTSGMWLVKDLIEHTGDSRISLAAARHDHAAATSILEVTLDAARTSPNGLQLRVEEIEHARTKAEEAFTRKLDEAASPSGN